MNTIEYIKTQKHFDVTILTGILHFLNKKETYFLLKEINKRLNKDGLIIIDHININSNKSKWQLDSHIILRLFNNYETSELKQNKSGFFIVLQK